MIPIFNHIELSLGIAFVNCFITMTFLVRKYPDTWDSLIGWILLGVLFYLSVFIPLYLISFLPAKCDKNNCKGMTYKKSILNFKYKCKKCGYIYDSGIEGKIGFGDGD